MLFGLITGDENSECCRFGGARYLDRCQKGCCPGKGVRSPFLFNLHSSVTVLLLFPSFREPAALSLNRFVAETTVSEMRYAG